MLENEPSLLARAIMSLLPCGLKKVAKFRSPQKTQVTCVENFFLPILQGKKLNQLVLAVPKRTYHEFDRKCPGSLELSESSPPQNGAHWGHHRHRNILLGRHAHRD
jgi:hypothetical protein